MAFRLPRPARPPARTFALWVVRLRFLLVPAWILAAVAATLELPELGTARGGALGSLVPADAPAVQTQRRSAELFRLPVLANTAVVQRNPEGLPAGVQADAVDRALTITRRGYPDLLSVAFALPVTNSLGLVPGSRERETTALTYLYFEPDVGLLDRDKLAHWFTERRIVAEEDALVGVTGVVPARVEQGRLIEEALPLVELATVALVALVLGVTFRSVLAPLMTLVAVGLSYLVAVRSVAAVAGVLGIAAPRELEPIILVLLLGIVTDYSIFFLFGLRARLREGDARMEAAVRATSEFTPIVVTAGLIVAAGTAALLVAELEFFRIFGPGLALTVLVGLAVSVTFVPAVLALLGGALFWPGGAREGRERRAGGLWRTQIGRLARSRRLALWVALGISAALVAAATGLARVELAPTPIRSLPSDSEPRRAAEAAGAGFVPGIVAPTLVLVEAPGLLTKPRELVRLQDLLRALPGVAGVIGPKQLPAEIPLGAIVAENGAAVRYIVFLREEPLSSAAIDDLRGLRARLPGLLESAGLDGARAALAGNTALAEETVGTILSDLVRIGVAALAVNLVLLVLFLRALLAPLYLLGASVLALAAALGLTGYLFQGILGGGQLTYYVPFMAAVLLVSLGSDYNVFLVGRIWHEARRRPLDEAIALVTPRASKAINAAGIALAASFALLALVPLGSFREFAFAMVVGVLIDAFVVRSYLVPALVSLVGPKSAWPGRMRATRTKPAP